MLAFALVLFLLSIASGQNIPVSQAALQGSWATIPCNNAGNGVFIKENPTFVGASFSVRIDLYNTSACSPRLAFNLVNGTYTIGSANTSPGLLNTAGLTPYNAQFTALSSILQISDPTFLAGFQYACAQPGATLNTPIDVLTLNCSAFGFYDHSPAACPNGENDLFAISNNGTVLQPGLRNVNLCQQRALGLDPNPVGKITSNCGHVEIFPSSGTGCTGTTGLQTWFPNVAGIPCQLQNTTPCAIPTTAGQLGVCSNQVRLTCPSQDPVLPNGPGIITVTAWPLTNSNPPGVNPTCTGSNVIIRASIQTGTCFYLATRFVATTFAFCNCNNGLPSCSGYSDPGCTTPLATPWGFGPLPVNNCQLDPANQLEFTQFACVSSTNITQPTTSTTGSTTTSAAVKSSPTTLLAAVALVLLSVVLLL